MSKVQPRHRPDKENLVLKTPGPQKSFTSTHKPVHKTPFHDENHTHAPRTAKKSVAFGQRDAFQTPAPRRILAGKDTNTKHTPFYAPPSTIKPFKDTHAVDPFSPPFSKPTIQRRISRRTSTGRASPVRDNGEVVEAEIEDIEYMPPTAKDVPYEPVDWEPIDWKVYADMKQDTEAFFVKRDEFGKSEMDHFVSNTIISFGDVDDLDLTFASATEEKVAPSKIGKGVAKRPAQVKLNRGAALREAATRGRTASIPASRTTKQKRITELKVPSEVKVEKFFREDLRDEVLALEREERRMLRHDDFHTTFDLEL